MNRTLAAVLIAVAFTAGNIAAPNAESIQMKRTNGTQQPYVLAGQAPSTLGGITTQPFVAKCVTGFQKYGEHKSTKGGVPVVQKFGCRTGWIECPHLPAYAQTWLDYKIETQGTGNEGKRIRLLYTCSGINPAG